MTTPKDRQAIYKECRLDTGLSISEWARIMHLGKTNSNPSSIVIKKEKPPHMNASRRVSMSDTLAAQLLLFLYKAGYDITNIEFNEKGKITDLRNR